MWELWLIITILFTFATLYYKHSFFFCYLLGASVSLITSCFLHNLLLEIIIFLCLCFILNLILTTPLISKYSKQKNTHYTTEHLIGCQGIVTKKIGRNNLETGLVKLDNEIWPALSNSGHPISTGHLVEVTAIKGVHLIVSAAKKR